MAYVTVNSSTSKSATNLVREGRSVEIQLHQAFGTLAAGSSIHMGVLAPGAKVSPTVAQESEDILGQNETNGQDVVLDTRVTSTTITYDEIPVVTPDATVTALAAGTPPTTVTSGPLAGTKIYPFAAGNSIKVALTVLRRRQDSETVRVYWHPLAALQAGESQDGNAGTEIPVFTASVQLWSGEISGAVLLAYKPVITKYGAIFEVSTANLPALQAALAEEVVPGSAGAEQEVPGGEEEVAPPV